MMLFVPRMQNSLPCAQLARSMGMDEFSEFDVSGSVPVYEPPGTTPDLHDLANQHLSF